MAVLLPNRYILRGYINPIKQIADYITANMNDLCSIMPNERIATTMAPKPPNKRFLEAAAAQQQLQQQQQQQQQKTEPNMNYNDNSTLMQFAEMCFQYQKRGESNIGPSSSSIQASSTVDVKDLPLKKRVCIQLKVCIDHPEASTAESKVVSPLIGSKPILPRSCKGKRYLEFMYNDVEDTKTKRRAKPKSPKTSSVRGRKTRKLS